MPTYSYSSQYGQWLNNIIKMLTVNGKPTVLSLILIVIVLVIISVTIRLLLWNLLLCFPPIRHLAQAIMRKLMGND